MESNRIVVRIRYVLSSMPSKTEKTKVGLVGPGFVAPHHIDAVRRLGNAEVVAIAGSSLERAQQKAVQFGVPHAYGSYEELIADPEIQVIHNSTPNYLHFPVNMAAIAAGKHIVSDKPLALSLSECKTLTEAAEKAGVVNAVTFNHRGYPLVQHMRSMIVGHNIGDLAYIHGHYLQDWMTNDRVYSWRMDPARGGRSSALADIGSHWCDLAQYIAGSPIASVFADLKTVVPTRYATGESSEAFAAVNPDAELKAFPMQQEDVATVLLRFANGTHGVLTAGQVLPGHKNDLRIEINGRSASLSWSSEDANNLWIGHHDRANEILPKDPALLSKEARAYALLPGGHHETWSDAFRNIIADIYALIQSGQTTPAPNSTVATFRSGTQVAAVIDAMLASHESGTWQKVGR
jgi:predicted dehydrogenase